jgi:hypothetical protein
LSARYVTSPALHLKIGESGSRGALYGALCLVIVYALCSVYARGYAFLAISLSIIAFGLLGLLRRNPMHGAELCWREGRWTLERDGVIREISPSRSSTALPWFVYIAFTDIAAGSAGHIWLYADSVPKRQLRRLRVRLTLLR